MWKKILIVFGVLIIIPLIQAQVGPTVFTPRLTVSPGPLTVTTGLTTVENIVINGTCTGCTTTSPGGANTQVQFNNGGAFGGDADMTFVTGTNTFTATNIAGNGSALTNLDAGDIATGTLGVARGGTGAGTFTGLLQGNGTSAFSAITNSNTDGQVLRVTGAATYAWGALNLADTDAVTGVLPAANGGTDALSGTFVATFDDACTTDPTITFAYQRVGNIVTIWGQTSSGFSCTGNSTSFATLGAPIPAAILPSGAPTTRTLVWAWNGTNNGAGTLTAVEITTGGDIRFTKLVAGGTAIDGAGWTNSGTRNITLPGPMTYGLGNPT